MPKSLEFFKERKEVEADWIWPGLLSRGNTMFVIGQPKKAAKSWLILEACWALSEGRPLWDIRVAGPGTDFQFQPGKLMRSVYFTQEDTESDIHKRVLAHFGNGRQVNDRFWIVPKDLNIAFDTPQGLQRISAELDEVAKVSGPIDLVAFDPLRRMHHGDENDSKNIVKMWEVLDRLHKRYGCATMISHHIKKPPSDRTHYDPTDPFEARGSGDIYGGGDAFAMVVPRKLTKEPPVRRVSIFLESKRGRPLNPAELKVNFATGGVEYIGMGFEPKKEGEDGDV